MKSPQGQNHETAGIRTPAYKTPLRKQRKCTYTFRIFELAPSKIPALFEDGKRLLHKLRLPPESVMRR